HVPRTLAAAAAFVALGAAAAQPTLVHSARVRERSGVEALFVMDTSRSMAASTTAGSPTRLDRAVGAAVRMRAAIADVPAGVATLTDRVLPDLLPVPDTASFDAVAERAVAIESPPPSATEIHATSYAALDEVASGNYFDPRARRRLVVLLTDGESNPVDPGQLAQALPPAEGYRFLAVQFWRSNETVYGANGKPETAYRPDPLGRVVLQSLANATGGRAYTESRLGAAISDLREAAGSGPTKPSRTITESRRSLAPYLAALALVLLALSLVPSGPIARDIESAVW
ncbi:MAG: hypothetical protein ACRDL2_14760, partial [Gaiellaceae bacterium]